jgi:23S rRNA C2498 (ribose-2'-O)-methylase RlmM
MIPVTHRWPVNPSKSDGFVEKAAQGLARSFASARPADVLVASSASDPQSRALASNVRGRCVQVFSAQSLPLRPAETPLDEVSPDKTIVFALITSKGLLAGLASPRRARSFYPTGVRFVRQTSEDVVSRAGAKLVDGLSLLRLFGTPCAPRAHWLELGASPGGMTAELLRRGQRVTALDRPALSPSLEKAPGLTFLQRDVASFTPEKNDRYDAILCDMNGPWTISFAEVSRLAPFLTPGAPCLYTLKFNELRVPADVLSALEDLDSKAKAAGLQKLIATHSAHNRNELTILLKKE